MILETYKRSLAQAATIAVLATGFTVGLSAATAQTATHTTLTAETRETSGRTVATFTAIVLDDNGSAAKGVVTLVDVSQGRHTGVASAALDGEGRAEIKLDSLTTGDHSLQAVYSGDASRAVSQSAAVSVHPQATATPDFALAVAPTSVTIKQGNSGALVATITPINSFTGFISLSCSSTGTTSNLPVGVTCTYSPANLQVTAPTTSNPTAVATANLSIQTTGAAGQNGKAVSPFKGSSSPMVLAILLPGVVGLGFVGRRRSILGRVALLAMVAAIGVLGTSACSARYRYFHHPPTANNGTPLGAYTIIITAQTSNGVTATTHSTPLALTVN